MLTIPSERPRLLYYCQSLVGIGHLTASLNIIEELLKEADLDLIYGGVNYGTFPKHKGFRLLQLPSLLHNEAGELYSPEQPDELVDAIWQQRQVCILKF